MDNSDIVQLLTEKWGMFVHKGHWWEQLDLSFISNDAKFNLLFDPLKESEIISIFQNTFQREICAELLELLKISNGYRLFSNSLCVYGIQRYPNDKYEPFDIIFENQKIHYDMPELDKRIIIWGSMGSQYHLSLPFDSCTDICAIDADTGQVVNKYKSVKSCFLSLFNNICTAYDARGVKKGISNLSTIDSVIENQVFEKEFLEK